MKMSGRDAWWTVLALCCASAGIAEAENRDWHYTYNGHGQRMTTDGPRRDVEDITRYTYDQAGNLTSVTNALGHQSQMLDHDVLGRPHRLVDANGVETVLSYHSRGWLLSSTVRHPLDPALDATTHYRYDQEGLLLGTTQPDGAESGYHYDAAQRLVAVVDGRGDRIEYALDDAGNRVFEAAVDGGGVIHRTLTRTFDELNRVVGLTGASDQTSLFEYDGNGNWVTHTDSLGNSTYKTYDALQRLTGRFSPLAHHVRIEHDGRDIVSVVTDPKLLETARDTDGMGNLRQHDSPDTGRTSYTYDEAGNRLTRTSANGVVSTYSYDALDRLTGVTYASGEQGVSYGYDAGDYGLGRLTSIADASGETTLEYDHLGNVVLQRLDNGSQVLELAYAYDLAGRLKRITYPSGRIIEFARDATGGVSAVNTLVDGDVQVIAQDIEYLPYGPVRQMIFGNGVQFTADFDRDYQVTRVSHGSVMEMTYDYDSVGNITVMSDLLDPARTQTYSYDALGRLESAEGDYGVMSYSYDSSGNRLEYSGPEGPSSYAYGADSHRLLQTDEHEFHYDQKGNLVARITRLDGSGDGILYRYGENNRLTHVVLVSTASGEQTEQVIATYSYNALGQRTSKRTAEANIDYLYGRDGLLLAEVRDDGLILREYVYLAGRPLAVFHTTERRPPSTSGMEWVLDDGDAGTGYTGTWDLVRKKGALNDYYRRSEDSGSTYRWTPANLQDSEYEVWAWWPKAKKNNASARYRIAHNGKSSIALANQSSSGKRWNFLGTYRFYGSGTEYIELSDEGGKTAADGIRLIELVQPPTETSTGLYYIHNDHLGTPRVITDGDQSVVWQGMYRPFGEVDIAVSTIENNLRFPGQYFDAETGLHYNYFRNYDPTLGRYLQGDPTGVFRSVIEPPMLTSESAGVPLQLGTEKNNEVNLYAYVRQNPISNVDLYGLTCYVQKSTGTRVCDTPQELGFSENFSRDGDNSAFPATTNDANVKSCIRRNMRQCNTIPTSPGKACDVRAAATQTVACSIIVVTKCTATGGN